MNYFIPNITNFHQELKVGRMKDVVRLFQKSLLVKKVLIFRFLNSYEIQQKD